MANEIIPGFPGLPVNIPAGTPATQLINQGSGPQIAHHEGNIIYNMSFPPELTAKMMEFFGVGQPQAAPASPTPQPPSYAMEWASLSHEHFCLFVLDNENYRDGWFAIAKDHALCKYTPDMDYYRPLTSSLIAEILEMPCIFAKRNRHHTITDADHPVVYGRLTRIIPQGSVIRFQFDRFKVDYQQTINQNMERYGLIAKPLHNQLDEEHWCIRHGDLPRTLKDLGIAID
jgi:hypothetical protein